MIKATNLSFAVKYRAPILKDITFEIKPGQFVAVLGENGAGKSSLIDIAMGFRKPTEGKIEVYSKDPISDIWQERQHIVYLSEKTDFPASWSVRRLLNFNRYFYKNYSTDLELELLNSFKIDSASRIGSMSAGESRRVQIIAALSTQPELIFVDEITAVLDITGRRRFMSHLKDMNKKRNTTIFLATNILEELETYVTHTLILQNGLLKSFKSVEEVIAIGKSFNENIVSILESP